MPIQYVISCRDGLATKSSEGGNGAEEIPFREEHIEALLSLTPDLLGVADHFPLGLDGGTTQTTPDMLFLDELGRLTVVEIKRVAAKLPALAQLLGYSDHWGFFPWKEADTIARAYTAAGGAAGAIRKAAGLVAQLAGLDPAGTSALVEGAAETIVPKLFWADLAAESLAVLSGKASWSPSAFSLLGAPSRKILIAPAFDDDCLRMAAALAEEDVNVQLLRVRVAKAGGKGACLRLDLEWVQRPMQMDRCWQVVTEVWKTTDVPERFDLQIGTTSKTGVVLAAKKAPEARVWISATPDGSVVTETCVPHGWYSGTSKRKQMTAALREALSGVLDEKSFGNFDRTLSSSTKLAKIASAVRSVAAAVDQTLVPHEPR